MFIFVFACKLCILFASAVASSGKANSYNYQFILHYKIAICSSSECGGNITLTHPSAGIITSPNYPSSYSNNLHCVWKLSGVGYSGIQFTFEDLDVEGYVGYAGYDFVQINDRTEYAGYSPDEIPNQPIAVNGTDFTLQFVTDEIITLRGFKLVYRTFKGEYNINTSSAIYARVFIYGHTCISSHYICVVCLCVFTCACVCVCLCACGCVCMCL